MPCLESSILSVRGLRGVTVTAVVPSVIVLPRLRNVIVAFTWLAAVATSDPSVSVGRLAYRFAS